MCSGDRVVEFESAEQDMDDAAEEATAAVEYCFMKEQPGYRIMVDVIQSGMIEKIGVVKTCAETTQRVKKTRHNVNEDELAMLHQQLAGARHQDRRGERERRRHLSDRASPDRHRNQVPGLSRPERGIPVRQPDPQRG
jgi:hypothetical protein